MLCAGRMGDRHVLKEPVQQTQLSRSAVADMTDVAWHVPTRVALADCLAYESALFAVKRAVLVALASKAASTAFRQPMCKTLGYALALVVVRFISLQQCYGPNATS